MGNKCDEQTAIESAKGKILITYKTKIYRKKKE